MSKITDTGMSRSEALIMDYLWEEGTNGKMFSEFMAYLSNNTEKVWAKQTVNTFLRRLIDKVSSIYYYYSVILVKLFRQNL